MKLMQYSLAALIAATQFTLAATVHVAPTGNDSNPGTEAKPFASLERARKAARAGGKSSTVILHHGVYRRTSTFELDARDSGTVYQAADGAEVRVIGGRALPISSVKRVLDRSVLGRVVEAAARPHLLQIDLKKLGVNQFGKVGPRGFRRAYIPAPAELFIDGVPMQLARWPNKGSVKLGKVRQAGSKPRNDDYGMKPGVFDWGNDRPAHWGKAQDVYISGVFGFAWADDTIPLAKIDTKSKTFTTALPHIYGFANKKFTRWYALNLIEEIDQPGEYFIDRKSGVLTFYPPEGFSKKSELSLSELDVPLVAIEGGEGVKLKDLIFEVSRGTGIYIEKGKGNVVSGCTFRNLGIMAVQVGKGITRYPYGKHNGCGDVKGITPKPLSRGMGSWHDYIYLNTAYNREAGTDHQIMGCNIHDMGAGGISLSGGDRKTLEPGRNAVVNCDIYRVNRWDRTYKNHVNIDGVGNIIRNCHMHDSESGAIYLHGNDHIMEYNEIDHVLTASSDMGAFYMGRDISEVGNVIRYNYFHDIKLVGAGAHVVAVYFDDGSILGAKVVGNVFNKVHAFLINGGGLVETKNNIFLDTHAKPYGRYANTGRVLKMFHGDYKDRVTKDVNISKPPYSTRYPKLLSVYNKKLPVTYKQENNLHLTAKDKAQFVDYNAGDLRLKPNAPSLKKDPDFKQIPFEKIGLYAGDGRSSLPFGVPTIDPTEAIFLDAVDVKLKVPTHAEAVVYTTDGSEPDASSKRYTKPIRLTQSAAITARAMGPGAHPKLSPSVRQTYTRLDPNKIVAKVNFQVAGNPVPSGWSMDDGSIFKKRDGGLSYGWTKDNKKAARTRGKMDDPLRDTLVHFNKDVSWELAVPNGRYRVIVCVGDSEFHSEKAVLVIEKIQVLKSKSLSAKQFDVSVTEIDVKDGRLSLSSDDSPAGPALTRINYLIVERMP